MVRLSRMTDYGVALMAELARTPGAMRTASELSESTGLSCATVAKLLKTLVQAGLARSVRGASGGYRVDRPATEISVAAVIEALEGPTVLVACLEEGDNRCAVEATCPIQGRWAPVNDAVRSALETVSLADLLPPALAPIAAPAEPSYAR